MHAVAILGQSVMQGDCCYECCMADCGLSVMPATCMKGSVLYSGAFIDSLVACVCECVCVCVLLDTTCAPCFKLISSSLCLHISFIYSCMPKT